MQVMWAPEVSIVVLTFLWKLYILDVLSPDLSDSDYVMMETHSNHF